MAQNAELLLQHPGDLEKCYKNVKAKYFLISKLK